MPKKHIRNLDAATAQLLTFVEVGERWRCGYDAVLYRLRKAQVPVVALGPGKYRIRLAEVIKAENVYV